MLQPLGKYYLRNNCIALEGIFANAFRSDLMMEHVSSKKWSRLRELYLSVFVLQQIYLTMANSRLHHTNHPTSVREMEDSFRRNAKIVDEILSQPDLFTSHRLMRHYRSCANEESKEAFVAVLIGRRLLEEGRYGEGCHYSCPTADYSVIELK